MNSSPNTAIIFPNILPIASKAQFFDLSYQTQTCEHHRPFSFVVRKAFRFQRTALFRTKKK